LNDPRVCIVDASVVLKWVLPETDRVYAVALLDDFEAERMHLFAPPTLIHEIASALSRRQRQKILTEAAAKTAFDYLRSRLPLPTGGDELAEKAIELTLRLQVSYRDALYLALAIEYRCDLVTADARFHRGAVKHYPYVVLLGR
jgi:predicted nucleic acid-binding protein